MIATKKKGPVSRKGVKKSTEKKDRGLWSAAPDLGGKLTLC